MSSLDEVVVVLGARADDVRSALDSQPVRFVVNARFADGQGTSLAAGIASLEGEVDAAVVLLGDQPHVDPAVIDRIVEARRRTSASIVMAQYGEERGHPVLFGREHFQALKALDGDQGGRDIIRHHTSGVMTVPAESPDVPADIDTEADWIAMLRRQGS
jgi:molybdenum cofactor cytidylyltransferase